MFNFLRTHHTIFYSICTTFYSHQQCTRILISPHPCQYLLFSGAFGLFVWLVGWFFLAMLYGLWDLSSPTRDRTWALGSESMES